MLSSCTLPPSALIGKDELVDLICEELMVTAVVDAEVSLTSAALPARST